ncbi:MAG TPA: hypothetical protein VMW69_02030 [Spirochaetia bacterium]|nr:hypothetical protein [Spirochaetia bacterium]
MPESDDLIDSAIEFLQTSCDQYEDSEIDERRRLKHSTISVCNGIELILKSKLAQQHWTLVLLSADRYRVGDLRRGAFQPVGLRDAMARLSEVCGVDISQQAETAFSDLADLRNKYTHFTCTETPERVTGIQLRAWHFVMDLVEHDFLTLTEEQDARLEAIRDRMLRREEFLAARFEQVRGAISDRATAGADVIMCPFCGHPALAVGEGAQCLVCGSAQSDAREYAEEYARRSAPWMSSDEFYSTQWAAACSECGEQACVVVPEELRTSSEEELRGREGADRDLEMGGEPWFCFNCGTVYDPFDIVECTRCGKLFARSGSESLCPNCSW